METKNQDSFVLNELKDLNYDSHYLVSPHGQGEGGLALIWKNHIDVQVLSANHNFIDSKIKFKDAEFFYTFVYGAPEVPKRQAVWDDLSNLSSSRNGAWYLTGDFNEIVNNMEKSGGKDRAESTFCAFRSFLSQCDLFDLQHTGNFLSWRSIRGSQETCTYVVHCRLDRAVSNSDWSDMFPTARSHYLLFEGSDYRPLLSVFDPTKLKSQRLFRYDRRLRYSSEVTLPVERTWNKYMNLKVMERISNCRKAISKWSKDQYLNRKKAIANLKMSLDSELSKPVVDDPLISSLNLALLHAYKAEEEYRR